MDEPRVTGQKRSSSDEDDAVQASAWWTLDQLPVTTLTSTSVLLKQTGHGQQTWPAALS